MSDVLDRLRAAGRRPYSIPLGGSNACGLWGYLCAAEELVAQGVSEHYDDIIVATGTGGTAAGLAIGLHLAGSRVRVHGVPVCNDAAYFYAHLEEYGALYYYVWLCLFHVPHILVKCLVYSLA